MVDENNNNVDPKAYTEENVNSSVRNFTEYDHILCPTNVKLQESLFKIT